MAMEMHHAYLLVGNPEEVENFFGNLLVDLGVEKENNPDFFPFFSETFGIDDARRLRELSGRKSFGDPRHGGAGKKVFYVRPERFTLEAQNALLKTLEEPTEGTHIFLVAREREVLVPTLLSRLQVLLVNGDDCFVNSEPEDFLKMSLQKRLDFAKKFSDSEASLPAFLDGLLAVLRKQGGKSLEQLAEVAKLRSFSDGPASSARLILEHLSFVV